MKEIVNIPKKIEEALLNFFILKEEENNEYWKSEHWQIVSYNSSLQTLFLRNLNHLWTRENDHKIYEQELDNYLKPAVGNSFQTGYFEPYQPKNKNEIQRKR